MAFSEVTRQQFEWSGDRLAHKPTGASFVWSSPNGESDDVTVNWGRAGERLESGETYDRDDLGRVAIELLAEKRTA